MFIKYHISFFLGLISLDDEDEVILYQIEGFIFLGERLSMSFII